MLGKNYQHTLDSIKADRVFVSWWSAFSRPIRSSDVNGFDVTTVCVCDGDTQDDDLNALADGASLWSSVR